MVSIQDLSERDICTKYITPSLANSGWNIQTQVREEVAFTDGKISIKGNTSTRGKNKRADYILYYKPNIPIAIIEAKKASFSVDHGIQQAINYASILDIPFVYSSNGRGFYEHDKTVQEGHLEKEIPLDTFPSPEELWKRYKQYKNINSPEKEKIASQSYYADGSGRSPRYYQQIAINRTVEAIANGQDRILLTMATGTGKTYTAFQIAHRLWKARAKKRILFLADRTALVDQTKRGDFRHFGDKMTVIKNRNVDKSYEIYLALYQGLTSYQDDEDTFKQFSPDFFDLIIIDECHRGSAADDSAWREILEYFHSATHIGLTATPKETETISSTEYFGDPIYTYSLKQGIADGFLAPYRVYRVNLNIDNEGWKPPVGFTDKDGNPVEDRIYNRKDFDKNIVIEERRQAVAKKITEYLNTFGTSFDKTIVFCVDIEHAQGMRRALVNENVEHVKASDKYIMQITGDNDEGKKELDNFINPKEKYPVIATTSKLMTTGVDAQTCKLIVLDSNIGSMTEFKQIIGRGTRINEEYDKTFFTILDFRGVTDLFSDPDFDGDPERIKVVDDDGPFDIPTGETDTGEIEPEPEVPGAGEIIDEPPGQKVVVNGVDVSITTIRVYDYDENGNRIVRSYKDYAKKKMNENFSSLDEFVDKWNKSENKKELLEEIENLGVLPEDIKKAVDKNLDIFDMICHVAFDRPPLSRADRVKNVRKRDYFEKYGDKAKRVIEALLDKYSDQGVESIESLKVLQLTPFDEIGSPVEIINLFGGKEGYLRTISELEEEIYRAA